ncbi:DUF2484 family protein [Aestuariibius sp. HNIBRBA575]|uniref:DUF2484 family protein n=1 Tax=Aestuariibius sp. HNIBRBA575 TaxID=3233343 RepID=UPI0034A56CFD
MSTPLILGCFWVLAATCVAMLPMRFQFIPGFALLIAAPILIGWIGMEHGWTYAAIGAFAFVSMFRRPLAYYLRKAIGRDSQERTPQ